MRQPDILDRCLMIVARLCPYLVGAVLLLALAGMLSAQEYYSVRRGGERRVEGGGSGGETNIPQFANTVLWWRMNEASITNDSSVVGTNPMTLDGGADNPTWVSAEEGCYFDGSDYGYSRTNIINGFTQITFSAWIKMSNLVNTAGVLLARHYTGSWGSTLAGFRTPTSPSSINSLSCHIQYDTSGNITNSTVTNEWRHVVGTWAYLKDGVYSNSCNYVNGVKVLSNSNFTNKVISVNWRIFAGWDVPGGKWNGNIDDPLIYNVKLTDAEVWQLYEFGHL